MLLAVALGKRRSSSRYVVTLHNNDVSRRLDSRNPFVRHATRWAIRRFDAVIVVNFDMKEAIEDRVGAEIEVLPAFLEAPGDELPYEPSIEAFLASGRTLLVPAFRVRLPRNGRDLYGLDLAVDAFSAVAGERPNLRLALFIAERPTERRPTRYLRMLVRRLEEAGLRDRASILFGLPLTPAFRHDVILVRPTWSEGDAVSVREALHAGVPVVASDVVERPSGTATFATGDVAGLRCTLEHVLDGTGAAPRGARRRANGAATGSDVLASLLRIYRVELDCATGDAGG
jgi:glycosyltransferase involved in cell wall biosynthesis